MPFEPDRREAEERDDRAGEPREADEPRGADPERDREQGDLFPWEENEPGAESGAGLGEGSGPARGLTDRPAAGAETEEAEEQAGTAGPRRAPGLMSEEKVLWEWPYPGDWIEEELD